MQKDKVKIIPLAYKSYNYGGTLQYYAFQQALMNLGYDVVVLDVDDLGENIFPNHHVYSLKPKNYIKRILNKILWEYAKYKTIKLESILTLRNEKFDEFRKVYINTEKCENLQKIEKEAKAIIAGSDQIWNPHWAKTTYFMNFVSDKKRKIVYAASIGRKELTNTEVKTYITFLKKVDAISVREPDIALQFYPYITQPILNVLDPVFLITSNNWMKIIRKPLELKTSFIFCYLLGESCKVRHSIKRYKKAHKTRCISIPYITQKYIIGEKYSDKFICDAGPIEFLDILSKAQMVITDSFHATAFSIIFHKDFIVLDREPNKGEMLSRITTLLKYFELESHLVKNPEEYQNDKINWDKIDKKILELKEKSLEFLYKSIENK